MSLSLEVKKFINSEHTGEYIDILLGTEIIDARQKRPRAAAAGSSAAAPSADGDGADTDASAAEAQSPSVTRENARIHYMEAGEGEPLILIHTVGQSLYTWRNVFERLSAHYRVIAIDLPGHGYSSRPETFGYTIEDYAELIGDFMNALNIESAHFMAFSLGAAYVVRFALNYPERVGRLVLLSPGGVTNDMPLSIRLVDSPVFGFAASFLISYKTVNNILDDAVFDLTNITPDVVEQYYAPIANAESRRAVRHALQYFDDEPLIARLRELKAPTLIVQGSEDKWHRSETQAQLFHSAIPNAAFTVIRNAGHLLHEEKSERILQALLEFIPVVMP